jgi:hypothetical protein
LDFLLTREGSSRISSLIKVHECLFGKMKRLVRLGKELLEIPTGPQTLKPGFRWDT